MEIKPKFDFLKLLKRLFYLAFIGVFLWVFLQLFFQDEIKMLVEYFGRSVSSETSDQFPKLRVIYPDDPLSLEPTFIDPATRQRLINIYEPLVGFDSYLNLTPSLALSYGLINNYTWEFHLRDGVVFHDGSGLDSNDVIFSINRAKSAEVSELRDFLSSIDEVIAVDSLTLRVKTNVPDPLLLQKLSLVLIVPEEFTDENIVSPVGTASYRFVSKNDGGEIVLKSFNNYWGNAAKFEEVDLIPILKKSDRVNSFLKGEADLLSFVSYDAVSDVRKLGFEVVTVPSLEVQSLVFNTSSESLNNSLKRKAISLAIDLNSLAEELGEFVLPVNQFVSNGIFGFNPNIPEHVFDLELAKNAVEEVGLKDYTLMFHLPKGLDVLGEHVRQNLAKAGVFVVVSYMEFPDLVESFEKGDADIYFLGFKSELGDASEVLNSIAYSNGDFNFFNFKDESVDYFLDSAKVEFDQQRRRDSLQKVMQMIVVDHVIGVPLFEYETVMSFGKNISIVPRIDGLIYFDEININ